MWQFSRAPELFSAFGWEVESSPDVEADDLLGSLAAVEADAGGRALIVTGDRDMYQCVSDAVSVLFLKSGITGFAEVDPAEVRSPVRGRAGARPRFHRAAGRSVGRAAGRAGDRAEDRGDSFGAVRVARWGHCRRFRRAAAGGGGVEGWAAELRAFRDIATLRAVAVDRPADRATDLDGGAVGGAGAGVAAAGGTARGRGLRCGLVTSRTCRVACLACLACLACRVFACSRSRSRVAVAGRGLGRSRAAAARAWVATFSPLGAPAAVNGGSVGSGTNNVPLGLGGVASGAFLGLAREDGLRSEADRQSRRRRRRAPASRTYGCRGAVNVADSPPSGGRSTWHSAWTRWRMPRWPSGARRK